MRPTAVLLALLGPLVLLPAPARPEASTPELDRVLERHAAARGGRQRLAALRSLCFEGRFATNSRWVEQRVWRVRPGLYRLERGSWKKGQGEQLVTEAYDGQRGWVRDPTDDTPEARAMEAERSASLAIDARLLGSLLEPRPGTELELVGEVESELGPQILVQVIDPAGWDESWYLDPQTYLPAVMVTRRWEWGRVRDMRYYFSDYREVAGVLFPFVIEDEFSSFHRMWKVERLVVDPELSAALFELGAPAEGCRPDATTQP